MRIRRSKIETWKGEKLLPDKLVRAFKTKVAKTSGQGENNWYIDDGGSGTIYAHDPKKSPTGIGKVDGEKGISWFGDVGLAAETLAHDPGVQDLFGQKSKGHLAFQVI